MLNGSPRANFLPGMHFCVARDITERKISEKKLNAEYSFRKALEDSVAAGITAINKITCKYGNECLIEKNSYY